jgi:hypothetical protein
LEALHVGASLIAGLAYLVLSAEHASTARRLKQHRRALHLILSIALASLAVYYFSNWFFFVGAHP